MKINHSSRQNCSVPGTKIVKLLVGYIHVKSHDQLNSKELGIRDDSKDLPSYGSLNMDVSPKNRGKTNPKNGWFINNGSHPMNKWMIWGYTPVN